MRNESASAKTFQVAAICVPEPIDGAFAASAVIAWLGRRRIRRPAR